MCAYGRGEREAQAFEKLIQQHPTGTLAIVADSYDFWNVMTAVLPRLKEAVMAREGKIVIRPDSGNPEHAGLIRLTEDFRTEDRVSEEQEATGLLKTVFKDGEVVRCTWEEVVARMTGIM